MRNHRISRLLHFLSDHGRRQSPPPGNPRCITMSAPQNILPPLGTGTLSNVPLMPPMMHPSTPQAPSSNADPMRSQQPPQNTPSRPPPPPLDTMRAYRACLNCRNRKSKCDLDINQGRPVSSISVDETFDGCLGESNLRFCMTARYELLRLILPRLFYKKTWIYLRKSLKTSLHQHPTLF